MTHDEFINQTIEMIKQCQCENEHHNDLGFKLKNEKNKIRSITITTQTLLIFEQLFGRNFRFNQKIKNEFDFDKIVKYLKRNKNVFINFDSNKFSKFNVNRCAYCGIGLLLLKEEDDAIEIADFLCNHKINNEYAWGINLSEETPDIISTYVVTMLLNRLHINFTRPSFLDKLMEHCDNQGISYNNGMPVYKYMEALTILLYMEKFYYFNSVNEEKIKLVNGYYYNGINYIQDAKEKYFKEHPKNGWRIYGFGLAANIVSDLNNPFYEYVLENLTRYFDKPETNIPYVLEICRMYNAIKRNNDPFREDRLLHNVNKIETKLQKLEKQTKDLSKKLEKQTKDLSKKLEKQTGSHQKYNREMNIKTPIATTFVLLYFLVFGVLSFYLIKFIMIKIFHASNANDLINITNLIISIIIPVVGFVAKKTRVMLIKLVDRFYQTFNIHKDENCYKENNEQSN